MDDKQKLDERFQTLLSKLDSDTLTDEEKLELLKSINAELKKIEALVA